MVVEKLPNNNAAKSEWNEFLRLSPQGSVFATTAYLDALNVRYQLHVIRKDGQIDTGLPLVRGLGGLLTNPLFCKYLGILTPPSVTQKASIAAGQLYARIEGFEHILRSSWTFDLCVYPRFVNSLA